MTLKDLSSKLRKLATVDFVEENKSRIQLIACNEIEAALKRRVFLNGESTQSGTIGKYSKKKMYVNPSKLPSTVPKGGLNPHGKNGSSDTFKNGKKRKTAYFADGYKGFKDATNFNSNKVNLTLSGASKDSLKSGRKGTDVVFGFSDEKRKVILEGNEKHFGKTIFTPNQEELKLANEAARKEIQQVVKEYFATW